MSTRHIANALAATLLASGTVVAGGPPATAVPALDDRAPVVAGGTLSRHSLVVSELGFTKPIRFTVRASDNVGVTSVVARLHRNDKPTPVLTPGAEEPTAYEFPAELRSGTAKEGVWTGLIFHEGEPQVGSFTVRVFAVDGSFNHSARNVKVGTYRVRWDTRFQNVEVKPAAPGKKVTVSGLLQHIGPNDWRAFGGAKIRVQFRAAGTTKWRTLANAKTGKAGRFTSEKVRASADGHWRAVYAGNDRNVRAKSAVISTS